MNSELTARCACFQCGNHLEFPIDGAGMTIDCPHCQQPTELTLAAPAPPPRSDKPSAAELLAAFHGTVPRTRVSPFYHLGLVLVTAVMVVLPMLYLCMIAAAAWGVYLFATHFAFLLKFWGHLIVHPSSHVSHSRRGDGLYLLFLFAYFGPLFIGSILVLFMVKPLFARRPRHAQPLALNPGAEPTLFAFIRKICELVGAPMPKRIDLVCELKAAAGFRRGAFSMFGNDLVLTVGLPLVAGLTVREFAGVMAHEFGHFTQRFGLRLSYIIRCINNWFARVVYERDAWDVWLDDMSETSGDLYVMVAAGCSRRAVEFSRLLLKMLMFFGHGICCFLMRQMEYDADTYEIKLAGSAAFESTARKMAVLNNVTGSAYKQMRVSWNLSQRLPDNFPAFLVQQDSKLPAHQRAKIEDTFGLSRTGLFDTHPSDGDRIRRARQAEQPGIFDLYQPATVLFSNFDVVSRQVTQLHYADDLGLSLDMATLTPTTSATEPQAQ